jgi:hypothetical protein
MPRPAILLLPLLLMACSAPISPPPRSPAERDKAEACRAEATRIVQFRERGQTMRTDETESGRGTVTVAPYSRVEADRGMAQMDYDRIMRDCMSAAPGEVAR